MKKITLQSLLGISTLKVELDTNPDKGVDIYYKDSPEADTQFGGYSKSAFKQFVRELAEALDMTLEEPACKAGALPAESIVLPKDVYKEVDRYMKYIYSCNNPEQIKSRADAKLWAQCRSDSEGALAVYLANKEGASIDVARIFMKELSYECEESKWVLSSSQSHYLSKACINDTGGWSMKFTPDIEEAIKFHSRVSAVDFSRSVSHHVPLSVEEV